MTESLITQKSEKNKCDGNVTAIRNTIVNLEAQINSKQSSLKLDMTRLENANKEVLRKQEEKTKISSQISLQSQTSQPSYTSLNTARSKLSECKTNSDRSDSTIS